MDQGNDLIAQAVRKAIKIPHTVMYGKDLKTDLSFFFKKLAADSLLHFQDMAVFWHCITVKTHFKDMSVCA